MNPFVCDVNAAAPDRPDVRSIRCNVERKTLTRSELHASRGGRTAAAALQRYAPPPGTVMSDAAMPPQHAQETLGGADARITHHGGLNAAVSRCNVVGPT
jgi:hypothetical protein